MYLSGGFFDLPTQYIEDKTSFHNITTIITIQYIVIMIGAQTNVQFQHVNTFNSERCSNV